MRRILVLGLMITLAMGLFACGDGVEKGAGGGAGTTASGAKTPQELLDKIEAFAESDEFPLVELVQVVHPDQQKAAAFVFSVLPMIFKMLFAAFGAKDGKADAAVEESIKEMTAVLEKHGLKDAQSAMQEMKQEGELTDEQKLAKMNEIMKDVDHIALLRDSWKFLDEMMKENGGESKSTSMFDKEAWVKARATLKVEGDTATIEHPDGDEGTMRLVKASDGFWYIDGSKSGLFKN